MASHSTKPIYAVNATRAEVDAIARRHHLLPQHYRCLWRVLARGEIKSDDFGNRIVWQPNYSRAVDELLVLASRDLDDVCPSR